MRKLTDLVEDGDRTPPGYFFCEKCREIFDGFGFAAYEDSNCPECGDGLRRFTTNDLNCAVQHFVPKGRFIVTSDGAYILERRNLADHKSEEGMEGVDVADGVSGVSATEKSNSNDLTELRELVAKLNGWLDAVDHRLDGLEHSCNRSFVQIFTRLGVTEKEVAGITADVVSVMDEKSEVLSSKIDKIERHGQGRIDNLRIKLHELENQMIKCFADNTVIEND